MPTKVVDDHDPSIVYSSGWRQGGSSTEQNGTTMYTNIEGATATLTFKGVYTWNVTLLLDEHFNLEVLALASVGLWQEIPLYIELPPGHLTSWTTVSQSISNLPASHLNNAIPFINQDSFLMDNTH